MATPSTPPVGKLKILIVEDETLVGSLISQQLQSLGHTVVGQASNADQAQDLFGKLKPDLVITDIRLDGVDGITLATLLLAERRLPIIILSAYGDSELVTRAGSAGVFGYLIKPPTAESLAAQIEVAFQRFRQTEQLITEKEQLVQTLETRKLVERAKGIFMKRMNLDEAEAHRKLQLESQKRRISLADLAKRVIESEDLLGGKG